MKTRIKELRLEKNLTQQALAKRLGINQASLSKIECGTSLPDVVLLIDLAHFFQVTIDYILLLSKERRAADYFLENNLHHLKKYQHLITIYQKMSQKQQRDFYNFLCSMLGIDNTMDT